MADVFISYSKREQGPTARVAGALRKRGLSVWWDANMLSGQNFREIVLKELTDAKAVIVIWTRSSVKSDWVISEAERAREMGKLITVRTRDIECFDIPQPFDVFHTEYYDALDRICDAVLDFVLKSATAEDKAWMEAVASDSYDGYLTKYPDGRYVSDAESQIEQEEALWEHVSEYYDYELYLEFYPKGRYAAWTENHLLQEYIQEQDELFHGRYHASKEY